MPVYSLALISVKNTSPVYRSLTKDLTRRSHGTFETHNQIYFLHNHLAIVCFSETMKTLTLPKLFLPFCLTE